MVILLLASLSLRVIITAATLAYTGMSLNQFAHLYDGNSYIITARSIVGQTTEFNDYHGRVFYGLPMLLAFLAHFGIPMHLSALLINWLGASIAPVLTAKLFNDLRVGYAASTLFPHTLMNSCLAMSESPMLALSLGGLLLMRRRSQQQTSSRTLLSGVLLGLATVFRPMACFALIAVAAYELFTRRLKCAVYLIASSCGIIAVAMLLQGHWRGDMLANFRYQATHSYAGQLLTMPFYSLLTTPFRNHIPAVKIVYIWIHSLVLFLACALAAKPLLHLATSPSGARSASASTNQWITFVAALWLFANTFFLLSLGSPWGFSCFHRFSIPAAPAMWWFLRDRLPRSKWIWLAIALGSATIGVLTIAGDQPKPGY